MLLLHLSLLVSTALAFVVHPPSQRGGVRSNTALGISSWGTKGPPHRWEDETKKLENPEERIQSYLPTPEAVTPRGTLGNACLVSGLVKSKERTDQTMFDFLHDEKSAFAFTKIIAFCKDVKFAKKRLLSRSARYTGLLDVLEFEEASDDNSEVPTLEQLKDVSSWIAYIDSNHVATVKAVAERANEAKLSSVAFVLVEAQDMTVNEAGEALGAIKDKSFDYTLIAAGKLEEYPEGKEYYQLKEFGTFEGALNTTSKISREEVLRIVTDTWSIESGINQAFAVSEVYNVNQTEAKLIRGLREAGYTRNQETEHMVRDGPSKYLQAIDDWKNGNPGKAGNGNYHNWWEAPEYQELAKKQEERMKEEEATKKSERQMEVEKIAVEWAKREFFRQSMAGTTDKEEKEFIQEVWDRALFEGDLRYRQQQGEATDEEAEFADFKAIEAKKKETMLKRAKQSLSDILQEEDKEDAPVVAKKKDEPKDEE